MIILDTNVVSALSRDAPDSIVFTWLDRQPRRSVWISAVSVLGISFRIDTMPTGRRAAALRDHFDQLVAKILERRVASFDEAAAAETAALMVIVSAYGDMANIRTAMNRGAFDFLTKPIDFADLETTIGRTIRHVGVLRESRRRQSDAERAHASLSRFFSPNLAEWLAGDSAGLDLGGKRREVASIFTDIAGFTTLVESLDPAILAELLNGYLGEMTEIVFAHDGTVAKIVGDAIHVLFGAPGGQPDHCDRAVACALGLDSCAHAFRVGWRECGVDLGVTRIGVHAGPRKSLESLGFWAPPAAPDGATVGLLGACALLARGRVLERKNRVAVHGLKEVGIVGKEWRARKDSNL